MPYFLDADDQARFGISEPEEQHGDDWHLLDEQDTCAECGEPGTSAWDHLPDCSGYEEMIDLPF